MKGEDGAKVIAGPEVPDGPPLSWLSVTYLYGYAESLRCLKSFEAGKPEQPRAAARRMPHMRYIDTNSYGIGVVRADGKTFDVDFLTFDMRQEAAGYDQAQAPVYVAHFTSPAQKPGGAAQLAGPNFQGKPPFPF